MSGPGPITARKRLVSNYFAWYQREIVRVLTKGRETYVRAKNSNKLNGMTLAQIRKPANDLLIAHIPRQDNPHKETLESIGTYTAVYVDSQVTNKVPMGIIPISTYGITDGMTDEQMNSAWVVDGWSVGITKLIAAIVSGTVYELPAWTVDVRTVTSNYTDRTFHIYLYLRYGDVSYQCREDTVTESNTMMYLGTVTTNASGIVTKSFKTVIRLDTFRLSAAPVGSALPVSAGDYDQLVKFPTAWNPA